MNHVIEEVLIGAFTNMNDNCDKDVKIAPEMVNHPDHYQTRSGIEVIDVIEAFDLGFNLGNVTKYVLRSEKKFNTLEDLKKAKWYLEREIANREKILMDSMNPKNR